MKPQYLFLSVLLSLALAGGVLGQSPAVSDDSLVQSAIAAIHDVPTIYLADVAYRKAVSIDPGNPEIYRAYMQRSLDLGRLGQAARAAGMLRFISPENALAWGVMAWQRMREGDRAEALDFVVRSLALRPDDPALLNLAGRLYAWHDSDPSAPALSDASGQKTAQLRDSLMTRPAFRDAFNEVQTAWAAGSNQPAPSSPGVEPRPAAEPVLAATGLGSEKIPAFAIAAFLVPQSVLQPLSPAEERIAAAPSVRSGVGPFGILPRSRRAPASRAAGRPGQALPPGTIVYASPPDGGQGQPAPGGAAPAYTGGVGSYGSDMGPMFPPNSRFLPTYTGGSPGGGYAGVATLQPRLNLIFPQIGTQVMSYR